MHRLATRILITASAVLIPLSANAQSSTTSDTKGVKTDANAKQQAESARQQPKAKQPTERQMLLTMREEEKLARDVYLALHDKWGENVFANIARAESRHMNAVLSLLNQLEIKDPIADNTPGVFPSKRFEKLYKSLVEQGSINRTEAFKVGLTIEDMDIADLMASIKVANGNNTRNVLGNLLRASKNHYRAFHYRLNSVGGTFQPKHLTQVQVDEILSSGIERGRGRRRAGNGRVQNRRGKGGH